MLGIPVTGFPDWPTMGITSRIRMALPSVFSRRSEEHTSELQSRLHLVCRLLLEKKKKNEPSLTLLGIYTTRRLLLSYPTSLAAAVSYSTIQSVVLLSLLSAPPSSILRYSSHTH